MWRIGKRSRYSLRNTRRSGAAACALTISWPVWVRPSHPRCETVRSRRRESPTGQPLCQKPPAFSCALTGAGSGVDEDWKPVGEASRAIRAISFVTTVIVSGVLSYAQEEDQHAAGRRGRAHDQLRRTGGRRPAPPDPVHVGGSPLLRLPA